MKDFISTRVNESIKVEKKLEREIPHIESAISFILKTIKSNKKIILCGNGGSAAQAQHIAGELVHKLENRRRALPAIALTTNSSILTAIGNDDSFDEIFERQIEGLGNRGDTLIAISTSGNSTNVLRAVKRASEMGIGTIGLTGSDGELSRIVDVPIKVSSDNTQRVQECHILIMHIMCEAVEKRIVSSRQNETDMETRRQGDRERNSMQN
jgi:D-sedoheptulose 7-phosphate isomerase